jgi:hypothetical protein
MDQDVHHVPASHASLRPEADTSRHERVVQTALNRRVRRAPHLDVGVHDHGLDRLVYAPVSAAEDDESFPREVPIYDLLLLIIGKRECLFTH